MLMQVCFVLHGHKINVLSQIEGTHTFLADTQYKALEGEHTPSLANLESKLHAQGRLEGGENWFQCIKKRANCAPLGAL